MRNRTKVIIGLALACAGTLVLGACATNDAPYGGLAEDGYTVQVRYDRNGGVFGGRDKVDLVDVYSLAKVEQGVALTLPGDSARKEGAATSTATKTGYFLVGWYRERIPLTDEDGNALDEFGELCSVSKREQGFSYSGYWDFEGKQKLTKDDLTEVREGKKTTYTFTLYAAWASFRYSFYTENKEEPEDGEPKEEWSRLGTYSIVPPTASIKKPDWSETTGKMDYGFFPTLSGYTITNAYLDADMTDEAEAAIEHPGETDRETGLARHSETGRYANVIDLPVYTTWREGTWYHITKASQMVSSVDASGCYEIYDDLNFDKLTWGFTNATFTGKILSRKTDGTPAKFSNIKAAQSNQGLRGGIFSTIGAGAEMENLVFENVTYTLYNGTLSQGGQFGLFAGSLSADSKMTNLHVTGTLEIGKLIDAYKYQNYTVGLLSGNLVTNGVTYDIKHKFIEVDIGYDPRGNAIKGYPVKGTVSENGEIVLEKNEDPSVDPNVS